MYFYNSSVVLSLFSGLWRKRWQLAPLMALDAHVLHVCIICMLLLVFLLTQHEAPTHFFVMTACVSANYNAQ